MKKIIGGILGLFLVIGIVAGTGYALFSDTVTMTGMVLGTATPGLEISFYNKSDDTPVGYSPTLNFTGQSFQKLLPGEYDWGAFWLRNNSIDGNDNPLEPYDETLNFSLKGSILSAGGNWNALKDVIRMRICVYNEADANGCDPVEKTNWYTMDSWFTTEKTLPGGTLLSGDERPYVINFWIPDSYGNEVSGLTISNMTMQVTGTQVL